MFLHLHGALTHKQIDNGGASFPTRCCELTEIQTKQTTQTTLHGHGERTDQARTSERPRALMHSYSYIPMPGAISK